MLMSDMHLDSITYNATIVDEVGAPICDLQGVDVALHGHRAKPLSSRYEVVYRPVGFSLSNVHCATELSAALRLDVPRDGKYPEEAGSEPVSPPSSWSSLGSGSVTRTSTPLSSDEEASHTLVIEYARGREMKIQTILATLDASQPLSLLFIADEGLDGDASLGFTRALRREYPTWTVRVATFDPTWTSTRKSQAAQELIPLAGKEVELKVHVDGTVMAPRVELAEPPASRVPLSLDHPWMLEDGEVLRIDLPLPSADHVLVQIDSVIANTAGIWQFAGKVDGVGLPVVGITTRSMSSHIQVHRDAVVELKSEDGSDTNSSFSMPPLIASTILALAVGPRALSRPERLRGSSILIHDADGELGAQIYNLCTDLGLEASLIRGLRTDELEPSYLRKPDFILSGTRERTDAAMLRTLLAAGRGRLLFWNDPEGGLADIVTRDPWTVGDALQASLDYHERRNTAPISPVHPSQLIPKDATTASMATSLFDPHKSYLLIGGIGSLGLYTALWMYQVIDFELRTLHSTN